MPHALSRRHMLLALPALLLAARASARAAGGLVTSGAVWAAGEQPRPSAALPPQAFLPLLQVGGARAAVRFYGVTGGVRAGPADSFAYGIVALAYEVDAFGGEGLPYREEWSGDGRAEPQLGGAGTVPANPATLSNSLLLVSGGPIPRGAYRLRFFVAGFLAADATATII